MLGGKKTTVPRHPAQEIKAHAERHPARSRLEAVRRLMTMEYPALFSPDSEKGGFVVTFPDFGWGVTQGDSEQEAMEMAADLLHILIADRIGKQEVLPRIQKRRGTRYRPVRLPALEAAKALLYSEWLRSGIRKAELARRIGISKSNIDRLFDLKHRSRLDHLDAAFRALHKELSISVRNAA